MFGRETRMLLRHYLEQGTSTSALARQLGISRDTVHRWIRDGDLDRDLDVAAVRYGPRPAVPTKLDAYKPIIEARLAELKGKLADARIIDIAGRVSETVVFGATVVLIEQEAQEKKQYTLVGQDEADLKFSRISVQSPVGRALIGKRVGDLVAVNTPAKVVEYEVMEIRFEEL